MTSLLVAAARRPSRPSGTTPAPPARDRIVRMLPSMAVLAVYATAVWLVFRPLGVLDATHITAVARSSCGCSDDGQQLWLLAATHADLAAGKLPFFTRTINYPVGVNLLDSAGFPLLATLAAPITGAVGPAATLALLFRLGMLASATSLFFVLRALRVGTVAAALGGAVYGFSPFLLRQAGAHLFLEFAPLPPIILYLIFDSLRRDLTHPWRRGLLVGVLLAAQALISIEVATSTVVLATGVAVLLLTGRALRRRGSLGRGSLGRGSLGRGSLGRASLGGVQPGSRVHLRWGISRATTRSIPQRRPAGSEDGAARHLRWGFSRATTRSIPQRRPAARPVPAPAARRIPAPAARAVPLVGGALAATPLLAYPLWYLFAGPEHISGTPSPRGAYPIGPLDTLLPNGRGVLAGLLPWRLPATGFLTDVGFVGFPLLVVAIVIVVRRRHDPLVVTAGLLGALAGVLMLGPSLQLGVVDLPMPFMVLAHLPLVGAMIPNRLALYVYLALGVLVAAGADRLWHRARTGVAAAKGQVLGAGAVLLASVALIAPSSAVPVAGIGDAQAFANGRLLERGAVVLAYPYPAYGHDEAMLWQATGGMRFELLGGYAEHPIGGAMVNGHPVALPPGTSRDAPTKAAAPIDPAALSDLFFDQVGRGSAGVIAAATRQLRPFVERNAVTAIAVDTGAANGRRVARVVTGVFGQPRRVGPLRLWSHLRGR